jgi:hypothetical protein
MYFLTRFLREPLVHFLAIGAALFLVYGLVTPTERNNDKALIVSSAMQKNIGAQFEATRMRPPNAEEMNALIQNYLREEVLYRRAVEMGLDTNDTVVRGRMRQKMEFFADSGARLLQPTDVELQAVLDATPEKFSSPARIAFRQVYLGQSPTKEFVQGISDQLSVIGNSEDFVNLGERTLLPTQMPMTASQGISGVFGPDFATAIEELETGIWAGPVISGYGVHLVNVTEKSDAKPFTVGEIRDTLVREWQFAKSAEIKEKQFADLLLNYDVVIEEGTTE